MRVAAIAILALLSGCAVFEDNATHLAYDLERGAKELRASPNSEIVVRYEPLGGPRQAYDVDFAASKREVHVDRFGNIDAPGGGYVTVTGEKRGGTNYHERFVFTPKPLHVAKAEGATEVVLRKVDGRVEVVELR